MKRFVLLFVLATPSIALADEPKPVTTKPVTIVGRPNRPSVVIELKRTTAAREAAAAHARAFSR